MRINRKYVACVRTRRGVSGRKKSAKREVAKAIRREGKVRDAD